MRIAPEQEVTKALRSAATVNAGSKSVVKRFLAGSGQDQPAKVALTAGMASWLQEARLGCDMRPANSWGLSVSHMNIMTTTKPTTTAALKTRAATC